MNNANNVAATTTFATSHRQLHFRIHTTIQIYAHAAVSSLSKQQLYKPLSCQNQRTTHCSVYWTFYWQCVHISHLWMSDRVVS